MLFTAISTFLALSLGALAAPQAPPSSTGTALEPVTVYLTRTCGCCGKWVDHLKHAGFEVTAHYVENVNEAPHRSQVPEKLRSCHSATVGGYAVEGHVPADVIKDLLRQKPDIAGIAVPGMPAGSPGMESPNPEPYEVVAFDKDGKLSTFAKR